MLQPLHTVPCSFRTSLPAASSLASTEEGGGEGRLKHSRHPKHPTCMYDSAEAPTRSRSASTCSCWKYPIRAELRGEAVEGGEGLVCGFGRVWVWVGGWRGRAGVTLLGQLGVR